MKIHWILIISLLLISLASCELLTLPHPHSGASIASIFYLDNTSTASVTNQGTLNSVDKVVLNSFAHNNADDVKITLQAPSGETVTLIEYKGSNLDDYVATSPYTFVDNTDSTGLSRIVIYNGVVVPETYQATGDFDTFNGISISGNWQLKIYDNENNGSAATLSSWTLWLKY